MGDVVIATEDFMGNNTKGKIGIVERTESNVSDFLPYYVVFFEKLDQGNISDNDWYMPEHLLKLYSESEY